MPKYGCVSVLGCVFGTGWLDHSTFVLASVVYGLAALAWVRGRFTPWSGWLSVFCFVVAASALWENLSYVLHKYVLSYLLLSALALIQHLQRRLDSLWAERLMWACVGQYYGFSGLSKLLQSGFAWADGLSMQIWVQFMGRTETQLAHYLLGSQSLAQACQAAALVLELSAWLLPFVPRWRRPWTLIVCVFHLTVWHVLGISFLTNVPPLLCLAFLDPFRTHPADRSEGGRLFSGSS